MTGLDWQVLPLFLAKTGIKYVCFTQKQLDYNILNILIDIHAKYIDQNNVG